MRALVLVLLQVRVVQAPPEQCGPVTRTFYASEVSRPASLANRVPEGPQPVPDAMAAWRRGADSVIVEFIVDTAGSPVPKTFRVVRSPSRKISARVREAHLAWRFRPARIGGCKVPQMVQTPIEWVAVSAPGRGPP